MADGQVTMAVARQKTLQADRVQQLMHTRTQAAAAGAPELVEETDKLLGVAEPGVDPLSVALQQILEKVLNVASDVFLPKRSIAIEAGALGYDVHSALLAKTIPFGDGSRLILVHDALWSMCDMLGKILALNLSPQQHSKKSISYLGLRAWRRAQSPWSDPTIQSSVALIRWHALHQRYDYMGAKLKIFLEERYLRFVDWLNLMAGSFITAHEVAHIYLGHPLGPDGDAEKSVAKFGPELEREADEFALAVVDKLDKSGKQASRLGALIALLALESEESCSFIRPAKTHPPVADRIEHLFGGMTAFRRSGLAGMAKPLVASCARANDIWDPLPNDWWGQIVSNERIDKQTHDASHFEIIRFKDQLADFKSDHLMDRIAASVAEKNQPDATEGLRLILDGRIRAGLSEWGVQDSVANVIEDPSRALTAYSLLSHIKRASLLSGAESAYRFVVSAAAVNSIHSQLRAKEG